MSTYLLKYLPKHKTPEYEGGRAFDVMLGTLMQLLHLQLLCLQCALVLLSSVVQHGLRWPHLAGVSAPLVAKAYGGLNAGCFEVATSGLQPFPERGSWSSMPQVISLGNLRLALLILI